MSFRVISVRADTAEPLRSQVSKGMYRWEWVTVDLPHSAARPGLTGVSQNINDPPQHPRGTDGSGSSRITETRDEKSA